MRQSEAVGAWGREAVEELSKEKKKTGFADPARGLLRNGRGKEPDLYLFLASEKTERCAQRPFRVMELFTKRRLMNKETTYEGMGGDQIENDKQPRGKKYQTLKTEMIHL